MFQRGLEPKDAMGTYKMPKCDTCGKYLNDTEIKNEMSTCMKCMNKKDVPFFERREVWCSPLFPFMAIAFVIVSIFAGIIGVFRWLWYSSIRPFTYSKKLCENNFHRYREIRKSSWTTTYRCQVCGNEKEVKND